MLLFSFFQRMLCTSAEMVIFFLYINISQICVQVLQAVILEYAVRQLSRDVEKYSESPPLSNNYSAMGITWEGVRPSG